MGYTGRRFGSGASDFSSEERSSYSDSDGSPNVSFDVSSHSNDCGCYEPDNYNDSNGFGDSDYYDSDWSCGFHLNVGLLGQAINI